MVPAEKVVGHPKIKAIFDLEAVLAQHAEEQKRLHDHAAAKAAEAAVEAKAAIDATKGAEEKNDCEAEIVIEAMEQGEADPVPQPADESQQRASSFPLLSLPQMVRDVLVKVDDHRFEELRDYAAMRILT